MDAGLRMAWARAERAQARQKPGDHRRHRGRPPAVRHERRPRNLLRFYDGVATRQVRLGRDIRPSVNAFGEIGVLDIAGINGYYTNLAMIMNTTRFPIPAGGRRLPRFPD